MEPGVRQQPCTLPERRCRPERRPPDIGDYGFLSDCTSAALVDRTGSVDWWCVPRFDSPSVFGRLLDPEAGHWTLAPVDPSPAPTSTVSGHAAGKGGPLEQGKPTGVPP